MPTGDERPDILVDTSVAVALTVGDHELHDATVAALEGKRLGLAGHALFETFSVLTRLPPPARRSPSVITRVIATNFPAGRFLSVEATADLAARLEGGEITGGAVYDALVGATAVEHGLTLATYDRRALDTYRVLGVDVELLDSPGQRAAT